MAIFIRPEQNIVLIGMPGCGKSTVGVLLAKALSRSFLDTDVVIQAREGRRLQDIIDTSGVETLRAIEERCVLALDCRGYVIATGGSVVYSAAAMQRLKTCGVCVYLEVPLPLLEARITNADSRGLVREPNQTLPDLYRERIPLYERYADVTVACAGLTHEDVVDHISSALGKDPPG